MQIKKYLALHSAIYRHEYIHGMRLKRPKDQRIPKHVEHRGMFGKKYDWEHNYNQPEGQIDFERDILEPLDSPIIIPTAEL